MATKLDLQRAMWAVHFHLHFHPDARPAPPNLWERFKPISFAEAVGILWDDAEARRHEARERTKDPEGVTPASLMALMRLYTAYELRGRYPDVFRQRFPDGPLPPDLSGVFPVNREKVLALYRRTAPPASPGSIQQSVTQAVPAALTIPVYSDPSDVPEYPLEQLPCPEPGFRLDQAPAWKVVFPVRNYVLDVTYHGATGWLSAVWSIDVQRPFAGMFKSLDPRNWDVCSINVDVATAAVRSDPCPQTDPGRPVNEGNSWQSHFWEKLGVNGEAFVLCNQLYFTFNVSAQAIVTTFSDMDPAGKETDLDDQIEFDRGWGAYGPAPWDRTGTWTRLRVVKYLKFTSGWLTNLAVLLLHDWADDEVTSLVACHIT